MSQWLNAFKSKTNLFILDRIQVTQSSDDN